MSFFLQIIFCRVQRIFTYDSPSRFSPPTQNLSSFNRHITFPINPFFNLLDDSFYCFQDSRVEPLYTERSNQLDSLISSLFFTLLNLDYPQDSRSNYFYSTRDNDFPQRNHSFYSDNATDDYETENNTHFQNYVEQTNRENLDNARVSNQDGGEFVMKVLTDHISKLSANDKKLFKEKISDSDPELFVEVPKLTIQNLIESSSPLTTQNTPNFAHNHLKDLEELRKQFKKKPTSPEVKNKVGAIATQLSRETDFIASLEYAFKGFAS